MSRKNTKTFDQVEKAEAAADKRKEPKEFEICRDEIGLYYIRYSTGGEVPDVVKGRFTTVARAQVAIDNVLAERKQKNSSGLEQR